MPKIQSLIEKFESLGGGMGCAVKENRQPFQIRKITQIQSDYQLNDLQAKRKEQPSSLPESIRSDYKRYCCENKTDYFKPSPSSSPKLSQTPESNRSHETSPSIEFPRRKSTVELVKPSRLFKDTLNTINDHQTNSSTQITSPLKLVNYQPRRASGPLYESRRNSYSSVKPSELNLNTKKKTCLIKETDENNNETEQQQQNRKADKIEQTSWIPMRKANNLVKPSAVKTAESNKPMRTRYNAAEITNHVLNWCQVMTRDYKNVEIKNWSSSWSDGLAFCALIHHFYPHAFDYTSLNPKNREQNFKLAFDVAEKLGNIAPLLDVEDMVRFEKPDSKCVYCYVSTIYSKLSKQKTPNKETQ